ncbi:MAG TPA: hypothetical protein VHB77_04350 [Planctomycetaceae bacterium]|nr:hypothetical protein [Planctomycetaceae bacterium]
MRRLRIDQGRSNPLQTLDRFAAPVMFAASLAFLACTSGLMHLTDENGMPLAAQVCLWGVIGLYPLFLLELAAALTARSPRWKQHLLFCFLPPLRLCARDHETGTKVWLPRMGWSVVDPSLRERIEKAFSMPMIAIALMVLPVMGIEQLWPDTAVEFIHVATGLIWLAFTFEFLTMIGIVERKVRYCKEHWIDLAVILLPLIAFLRVARLGRLLRLQQLSKTARVYRIRGLMMRAYRAVLVLELVERLMRGTPEKQLAKLREQLAEKEQEVAALRSQIESLLAQTTAAPEEAQRLAA